MSVTLALQSLPAVSQAPTATLHAQPRPQIRHLLPRIVQRLMIDHYSTPALRTRLLMPVLATHTNGSAHGGHPTRPPPSSSMHTPALPPWRSPEPCAPPRVTCHVFRVAISLDTTHTLAPNAFVASRPLTRPHRKSPIAAQAAARAPRNKASVHRVLYNSTTVSLRHPPPASDRTPSAPLLLHYPHRLSTPNASSWYTTPTPTPAAPQHTHTTTYPNSAQPTALPSPLAVSPEVPPPRPSPLPLTHPLLIRAPAPGKHHSLLRTRFHEPAGPASDSF